MSDFAYDYFNSELDKLDIPSLQKIFDKVQRLLLSKKAEQLDAAQIDKAEVERINAVYSKIPENEQLSSCQASMQTMWETVNDKYNSCRI